MLSDRQQSLATNSRVDETTNRFLFGNHSIQIRHKVAGFSNLIGIVTTTHEGDGHLLILHIADVFDGAGLELEHNKNKKVRFE